jgi:hypothetical protein
VPPLYYFRGARTRAGPSGRDDFEPELEVIDQVDQLTQGLRVSVDARASTFEVVGEARCAEDDLIEVRGHTCVTPAGK